MTASPAANPFRDLGDNMTLAGFLVRFNLDLRVCCSSWATTLRARRLRTSTPEVEYDPETGRFMGHAHRHGSPRPDRHGFILQANILAAHRHQRRLPRNLIESNPTAATRTVLSSKQGSWILWKKYNLNEQAFTAEMKPPDQCEGCALGGDAHRRLPPGDALPVAP